MTIKSIVIKVGFADVKEAEKKINEELKSIKGFTNYIIVNNGQHSSIILFYDEKAAGDPIMPQVKIIEYSITDIDEAQKAIDEALEGIEPISIDVATPIDGNRLIVLYDATPAAEEDSH